MRNRFTDVAKGMVAMGASANALYVLAPAVLEKGTALTTASNIAFCGLAAAGVVLSGCLIAQGLRPQSLRHE